MATKLHTPVHVSTGRFSCSTFYQSLFTKANKFPRVSCALSPPGWRESRRLVSFSLVISHLLFFPNNNRIDILCWKSMGIIRVLMYADAIAGSLLDKYVKRKKLDPLEVYVPPVILTQLQIKDLEKTLEVDKPEYASCRSQLRNGPAASLRVNIRAVAQYASDAGNGKSAFDDVDQCLRALEDLDSLFLRASRNEQGASVKSMKAKIVTAINALDSLLHTVPSEVLDKGKAIADAYRTPDEGAEPEILDPEIKQLESIL
ncbi:hypothetical protein JRO89_XS03G0298400 [Xanthoceras sorbifolium]|uniref:DUF7880 domain-containing protein n=1 Tax=Xanthoceras sorbifolium TaxID=99658 RepID=A0ABQ8IDF5_9ROSI|nr:hypothetical protein JRO89_XS03G0298400 [Xanthoceras sorbifolium]